MDETIQEFQDKFNNQQILDAETLRRCSISTGQSVAKNPWRISTTNYKEKIKAQKSMVQQTT